MNTRRLTASSTWSAITEHPPIAHQLKSLLSDRWIRFHSLPDAKRYATTDDEHRMVLARADELMQATLGSGCEVLLVTGQYGPRTEPPEISVNQATTHTNPEHWYTQPEFDAEDPDWPLHLWMSWEEYSPKSFDGLIALAANFDLIEVMVIASGVVYHPYDGGMDVITPTSKERDAFKHQFADWASPLPSGL